ncbi:LEA type 2 family protein [Pseudomonas sp. RP23018S]|uniref:LEA type 2 family protein n=1 Tax=Pseudomonas sp. RP23018S TaxID=3096037 RepID=UPI002ACA3382|nr:LEA type 2 family protein [Pseudomonas sp. RP23018S]MDZ5603598.1 LEA type 2 family protein [Pseudomonas sp. RP23018S]
MILLSRALLLGALLSLLTGCMSWGASQWREPQVHLVKVKTVKARLHQQEFILHLRVDNPNDSRLFIRNLDYAVKLNDIPLVLDNASLWRSVAAHDSRTFKITVRTNLWRHLKPLARLIRSKKPLLYSLEAEINTGVFFHDTLHVSRSGEILHSDFLPE